MHSVPVLTTVKFEVAQTLVVSDPCYLCESADGLEFSCPAPGHWTGTIETQDEGSWGRRVATLRLERGVMPLELRQVGEVGVDSGQMYAGCLTDLPLNYEALLERYQDGNGNWQDRDCLDFGGGIVCQSGYGDGLYPVYADDDFTVIEVRFLEEVEE